MKDCVIAALLSVVGVFAMSCVLACTVYAGDGSAGSVNAWQALTGLLGFVSAVGGWNIWKKIAVIKELKETYMALCEGLAAIHLFTSVVSDEIKDMPEFKNMVRKIDKTLEEIADVMVYIPQLEGRAVWLRNMVHTNDIEELKRKISETSVIIRSAKEVLANNK